MNRAVTANGASSYRSTGSALLDFFANAGSMRLKQDDMLRLFSKAVGEHKRLALQTALWLRDARGGAGERQSFRNILKELDKNLDRKTLQRVLDKVPTVGRWDDLLVIEKNYDLVNAMFQSALVRGDGLWAKWMPVKGIESVRIRRGLGMDARTFRKTVVALRSTVEQNMCSGNWRAIDPSKIPGLALSRYTKAFFKRIPDVMTEFKSKVKTGEVKIKTQTMYPYDVVRQWKSGSDRELVNATWAQLPDYVGDSGDCLPIIDVSSSMNSPSGAAGFTCMDIAIALGLYVTQRQKGAFRNLYLTFNSTPELKKIPETDDISEIFRAIADSSWGGSTNLIASFKLILERAKSMNLRQEDLPSTVLLISDMQFDIIEGRHSYGWDRSGGNEPNTNLEAIRTMYEAAGYVPPKMVFWQVNGNAKDTPATMDHSNVSLFSGFSPSILKAALKNTIIDPSDAMMEVIDAERYKLEV